MNPVIGIDVSKGESEAFIMLDKNKPYGKSFRFQHTHVEMNVFFEKIHEIEILTGLRPIIVLEATGHYHLNLVAVLQKKDYEVIILNPLIPQRARKSKLRKVKTDAEDAKHLAELYYKEDLKVTPSRPNELNELRFLSRQYEVISDVYVQATDAILHAAQNSLVVDYSPVQVKALLLMINLLMEYQSHLADLAHAIKEQAANIPEFVLLCSVPGIGDKLAATIIAEIGDISSFNHAKKLVAFAGVDPSLFSSGKFSATKNRITKRGSNRLRRALYLAVLCGIRGAARNERIRRFYDKKRLEGKPHRVALIACTNKLLHIIYAMLKKAVPYQTV